jgi:hypothetical protein
VDGCRIHVLSVDDNRRAAAVSAAQHVQQVGKG